MPSERDRLNISSIEDFLAAHHMSPSTPVSAVRPVAQPQQAPTNPDSEYCGTNNFLKPSERRSFTTPAGTSQFSTEGADPFPGRVTAEMRREEYQQAQREAAAATQLSGSNSVRVNPRIAAQQGWEPHFERRAGNVLSQSWSKVGDVPRDPAGRPVAQTDVDAGWRPGADFW